MVRKIVAGNSESVFQVPGRQVLADAPVAKINKRCKGKSNQQFKNIIGGTNLGKGAPAHCSRKHEPNVQDDKTIDHLRHQGASSAAEPNHPIACF